MTDLLAALRITAFLILRLRRSVFTPLIQPSLTVALLALLYGGGHVWREGNLVTGLSMAFFDDERTRAERQKAQDNVLIQAELHRFVVADKLIDQLLEFLLQQSTKAARARLEVIHNGVTGLNGAGLLRYDVTNSVAAAGRSIGTLVTNRPLAEWSDILPPLLGGQCIVKRTEALRSPAVRGRFEEMATDTILVCPAVDVQGKLLGAVFVLWDVGDEPPNGHELKNLTAMGERVAAQIAAVLNLNGPAPWPSSR